MNKLTKYTFSNICYLFLCVLRTKLFYGKARLIRFPFDIRNKDSILIGKNFTTGRCCRIESYGCLENDNINIIIGDNVQINDFVHIASVNSVFIGNHVLIASKVFITDINHGDYSSHSDFNINIPPINQPLSSKSVNIGDYVWIGESVCVLPGVTIGEHSIIGAMSCVTKSIPSYSIAVGNPAKVIKKYDHTTKSWMPI